MKRRRSSRYGARRPLKKRRYNRRRYGRRSRTKNGVSIVKVKRTTYVGNWVFSTATTAGFWRYNTVQMADFNNFAEYASVFDEYKLCAVKYTYRPRYDSVTLPNAAGDVGQPQAYAHIIIDPESSIVPAGVYNNTTLNQFLENGGVRTKTMNRPFSIYFRPKTGVSMTTGSKKTSAPWLNTTITTLPFSGFHMYLQQNSNSSTNTNIQLDTFVTFYMKFRGQK